LIRYWDLRGWLNGLQTVANLRTQTARAIVGGLYPIAWRLVLPRSNLKVCSVISGGQFTVVEPGRMPLVNWAESEREEIGYRVANFQNASTTLQKGAGALRRLQIEANAGVVDINRTTMSETSHRSCSCGAVFRQVSFRYHSARPIGRQQARRDFHC
jgi:hypothetical protein